MNRLHDHLDQAADDTGRPLPDIPDLLQRARASRQRHHRRRGAAAVAGVAVLTAVAALAGPSLVDRAEPSGERRVPITADDGPPAPAALAHAEIVRRCTPQLDKYFDYPMYAESEWKLSHDRGYAAGDVVSLRGRASETNPVLCVIPEEGQEQQDVPFATLQGAPDRPATELLELCSENYDPSTIGDDPDSWTDLRDGELLAVTGDPDVTVGLVRAADQLFTCALSSPTWDAGLSEVYPTAPDVVGLSAGTTGASNKSIVEDEASFYTGAGTLDAAAETLEIELSDGYVETVPVEDGAYAVMVRRPGEGGLLESTYRVLDGAGRVLDEGRA